jgi:hypothetical protein
MILAQKRRLCDPEKRQLHSEGNNLAKKQLLCDPENRRRHCDRMTSAQLHLFYSNMDLQFITDGYSVASYLGKCVFKNEMV